MDENMKKMIEECNAKEATRTEDFHTWIDGKIFEATQTKYREDNLVYTNADWDELVKRLKHVLDSLDSALGLEARMIKYFEG